MSVVGSDWETLKRFNLAELYQPPSKIRAPSEAEAKPEPVTTDEAAAIAVITDGAIGLKSYP
jgi:tRNA acetyltransferase TAN1